MGKGSISRASSIVITAGPGPTSRLATGVWSTRATKATKSLGMGAAGGEPGAGPGFSAGSASGEAEHPIMPTSKVASDRMRLDAFVPTSS